MCDPKEDEDNYGSMDVYEEALEQGLSEEEAWKKVDECWTNN